METTQPKEKQGKQFDFSDLYIKERLQGVRLASFQKRAFAYLLDWGIIFIAAEKFAMIVLLVAAFLVVKGRLKRTVQQGSTLIEGGIQQLDNRLATLGTDEQLRKNFTKYMQVYIKVMICIVVIASIIVAGSMVAGIFMQEELEVLKKSTASSFFLQPFQGVLKEVSLLSSAIGGLLYFSLFTWRWNGQTPGKKIMKVQVVRLNGKRISLWSSLERMSGYTASASLLLLGFFQYFWDRNRQTTHDKITETIVVNMGDQHTAFLVNEVLYRNSLKDRKENDFTTDEREEIETNKSSETIEYKNGNTVEK